MNRAWIPLPRTEARALRLLVAFVIAVSGSILGPASSPAPVRAAMPALILVTATTYEVLPDEGRVAVTVRIAATNRLKDTVTKRYYYEEGLLAVLPGTSNFRLTAESGTPSVAVRSQDERGVYLRLRFGSRLAAGQTLDLTLTFDLIDPGGAPDRPLRISPSFVAFQAWAYASAGTPGSSVEVRVPGGYAVEIGRGPLVGPATDADGWHVYTSGELKAPLLFVADVTADRTGGYVDSRRSSTVGDETVIVVIRAWPDDPAWRARVGDLFVRALAILGDEIEAPWPFTEDLTVEETLVRKGGEFVGTFDPEAALIRVGHTASAGVVLHEAAHGWFNGRLVADRWIAEAFAAYYAERAAAVLELAIDSPELGLVPIEAKVPLNAWPAAGMASAAQDDYGYPASLTVAREVAALVGDEGLRDTWVAAATGMPAYQPGTTTGTAAGTGARSETGAPPPDWRALLDLLEDGSDPGAGAALERLWRRWVIRPNDATLLDARSDARTAYAAAVAAAAPWALPRTIRDAMRTWQFKTALRLMRSADAVLRQRATLVAAADVAGLSPPDTLRRTFEGEDGFDAAAAEAATELAVIGRIQEVAAERIAEPGLLDRLGLIGEDPDASLDAARAAFEAGDLDRAIEAAAEAEDVWQAVPEVARGRVISAALLLAAGLLLLGLARQLRRPRRIRHA
jgi:hypothetical protein